MEITEVRIKLMDGAEDRLRAFCSITFNNCFVIRDLKIIDGNSGPFVAMPSRKLAGRCADCGTKNHLRARYCNQCGRRLPNEHIECDEQGRVRLYADVAHPINARCREMIQRCVLEEYERELERAAQPGYVSRYDHDFESDDDDRWTEVALEEEAVHRREPPSRHANPPHHASSATPHRTDNAAVATDRPQPKDAANEPLENSASKSGDDFGRGIFD